MRQESKAGFLYERRLRRNRMMTRLVIMLAVFIILFPLLAVLSLKYAHAGEWGGYPIIEWGVEKGGGANGAFFCQNKDDLIGNQSVKLPVYRHKGFTLMAGAHHHSCLVGPDMPSYDGYGLHIELDTSRIFK